MYIITSSTVHYSRAGLVLRGGGVPRAEGPGLYLYNSTPTKFHIGT